MHELPQTYDKKMINSSQNEIGSPTKTDLRKLIVNDDTMQKR
ncbi:hypothetical protein GMES_2395 [Paraglaciecola mesophila KMM 241]|uniref:Uncharacterized protein n=1 Tax=Paraglaciecola mesophila KMM 241 TaxID=1128912 RepID=K6ZMV0_9ALTE|nr:hypothetical protein GMES_2395 [Paraglaciecola mesophila KMM 241]